MKGRKKMGKERKNVGARGMRGLKEMKRETMK